MEEILDAGKPDRKIYKDRAIGLGTLIGGPLVAGYLIAENFKVFNRKDRARNTWIIAIVSTLAVLGLVIWIPDDVKIPNQLFPLAYTGIAYLLVQRFQEKDIEKHINAGGQTYGWGRPVLSGFAGFVVTVLPILFYVLYVDAATTTQIKTRSYGTLQHEISYNQTNVTDQEVDQIAEGLTRATFFDDFVPKFVFAEKSGSTYELSISVIEGVQNDEQALEPFVILKDDLQAFIPDHRIVVHLVVDRLDNIVQTIE